MTSVRWLGLLCALLSVSCGGASERGAGAGAPPEAPQAAAPVASAEQLCAARCERQAACGAETAGCLQQCRRRLPDTSHYRPIFTWRLLGCFDALECSLVVQGQAWRACFERVSRALELSDALRRFCFASARRAAACGRAEDAEQGACRDRFRHLSDGALRQAFACLSLDCARVPACFADKLGG